MNSISKDAVENFNIVVPSSYRKLYFETENFKFNIDIEHRNSGMYNRLEPAISISNPEWQDVIYANLYPDSNSFVFVLKGPAFCDYPDVEVPKIVGEQIEKEFWEVFTEDFLNKEAERYLEEKLKAKKEATAKFFGGKYGRE